MIPIMFTSSLHYFQGPRRVYSAAVIGTIASSRRRSAQSSAAGSPTRWNWHWLFYVNLAPGIAITLSVPLLVDIDRPDLRLLKDADYPGIVLMAICLGTLEYVLEEGTRWNWFDDTAIKTYALYCRPQRHPLHGRSLTFPRPVVDLRALTNRNFALSCFLSFVTGVGIFSTIYLTPLFLGYVRDFCAWQTGCRLLDRRGLADRRSGLHPSRKQIRHRWLMMFGLASFGFAMWSYSFITHDWGGAELLLPQVLRGFPQVFAVAPASISGSGSLPPERLKYASGLFNMMRNLGGAVGIAVCGAIINDRTNFHFLAIASSLTPANGAMTRLIDEHGAALRTRCPATLRTPATPPPSKHLWQLAYREASTLAYADAFRAIMIAFAVATLLVPFLRNVTAPRRRCGRA